MLGIEASHFSVVRELNGDSSTMGVNPLGQRPEAGEKSVIRDAEFVGRVRTAGITGRGIFRDDESGSSPSAFFVIRDDRFANVAVGFGNFDPHGCYRDSIAKLESADLGR